MPPTMPTQAPATIRFVAPSSSGSLFRFSHGGREHGATIAVMAKFKPARGKGKRTTAPPAGALSCVILILVGMVGVMLFMYFVMYANR